LRNAQSKATAQAQLSNLFAEVKALSQTINKECECNVTDGALLEIAKKLVLLADELPTIEKCIN